MDVCLCVCMFLSVCVGTCNTACVYHNNQDACDLPSPAACVCTCVGLARTIYSWCIYFIFGREITKYTVIYGEHVPFWPTLHVRKHTLVGKCVTL